MYTHIAFISTIGLSLVSGTFAAAIQSTSASLVAREAAPALEARANSGVYICQNINFAQPCIHLTNPFNDCINLDGFYNDQVTAFGPDAGSECTIWSDSGCSGASRTFRKPGTGDLRQSNFNDVMSSYKCTQV